jgi:hypothetical protein
MAQHYTYRVRGRGDFPLDMLRYDECRGCGQADRRAIEQCADVAKLPERTITLIGARRPTIERWQSFGWAVVGNQYRTQNGPFPQLPTAGADLPSTTVEAW